MPKQTNAIDREINWMGPYYGRWDQVDGGTSVVATLGPAAGRPVNYGKKPGVRQCPAVNWLNQQGYLGKRWVKGHLLNDNLGGPGLTMNLTPMSHTANLQFEKAFESKVKRALDASYSHGLAHPNDPNWYGVNVRVKVKLDLTSSVGQRVRATACYIRKKKASGSRKAVDKPNWAPKLPATTVVVDCSA